MTRMRLTHATRLRREYRADIEVDGRTVGYVERQQSNKMLGYRAGDYRAFVDGRIAATGGTLTELREGLREHFANEYPDAKESW